MSLIDELSEYVFKNKINKNQIVLISQNLIDKLSKELYSKSSTSILKTEPLQVEKSTSNDVAQITKWRMANGISLEFYVSKCVDNCKFFNNTVELIKWYEKNIN